LTLTTDEQIEDYLESLERESKAIKEEALRFTWWMRGGVSYEESMQLSWEERTIIAKIIEDNMETAKKSQMPFW
jgi:hypothetical protein